MAVNGKHGTFLNRRALSVGFQWEIVERGSNAIVRDESYVAVRHAGLKLSSAFEAAADVHQVGYEFVRIKRDNEQMCLLLEFFTKGQFVDMRNNGEIMSGFYPLQNDGGGRGRKNNDMKRSGGAMITCGRVIQNTSWLYCLTKERQHQTRRFTPEATDEPNAWVVRFMPIFASESSSKKCEVASNACGIYRYLDAKRNVLYIGQGRIKKRFDWHAKSKQEMPSTIFQWTQIGDKAKRLRAESYHLRRHVQKHGQLPPWNRCLGQSPKDLDEEGVS